MRRIVVRSVLYTLLLLVLLLVGALIALQLPAVQTRAVQYAARRLSATIGFPIQVASVRIRWFDTVTLRGVRVDDRAHRPMIAVAELDVDFQLTSLLDTNAVRIDEATLHGADVRLVIDHHTRELNLDEFIAAINRLTASKNPRTNAPSVPFVIDRVTVDNARLHFSDEKQDSLPKSQFDYQHFTLDSLSLRADRFKLVADTIELRVRRMRAVDPASGLRIAELNTDFHFSKHRLALANLLARVGQSTLRRSVIMTLPNGTRDLGDFNNQVRLEADLDRAVLHAKDLALFAPYLARYTDVWRLSGHFRGRVKSFRIRDANLAFGQRSALRGDVSFDGLPNFGETFINLNLQPSEVHATDLPQYLSAGDYAVARKFGRVRWQGKFVGFPRDFVANGSFDTDLGRLVSDINLKLGANGGRGYYEGRLRTVGFELGRLTDRPLTWQKIDMAGRVEGRGLTWQTAALQLDATVTRLGFEGYDYRNMTINGDLQRSLFAGELAIRDPNLTFDLSGELDFRNRKQHVDLAGRIQHANFKALGLSPEEFTLATDLFVQFDGLDLDEVTGEAQFSATSLVYRNRALAIDTLDVYTFRNDSVRVLDVRSDLLNAHAQGSFTFAQTVDDLRQLAREYQLYFGRDQAALASYYRQKNLRRPHPRPYRIDYNVLCKNVSPVVALFDPHAYLARNTHLDGYFVHGNTDILSVNGRFDTLQYGNNQFYGGTLDVSTSKRADSASVLASAFVASARQTLGGVATEQLTLEGVWNQDRIDFQGRIRQQRSTNRVNLRGDLRFIPDGIVVEFAPSRLVLLDQEWHFAPQNATTVRRREVSFSNVMLASLTQSLTLSGAVSANPGEAARLHVTDFDLAALTPLVGYRVQGMLNGDFAVRQAFDSLHVESDLLVEELTLDNFLVGNLTGTARWDDGDRRVRADYQLDRMGKPILALRGTYDPNAADPTQTLDLVARLDQTDLELLTPFVRRYVSEVGGTATGAVNIRGSVTAPRLRGELNVRRGQLRYKYLNALLKFEDKITISENRIGTRGLRLTDDEGNTATLSGGVYHDNFRNLVLDFEANLRRFKMLNTTRDNGELYYGTAFATGKVTMLGALQNLEIRADVRSDKGTRMFIPLDRSATVEQQADYITFVNKSTDTTRTAPLKKVDLSGVRLDFNLELTPDAYGEIIFDSQTGDKIAGVGNGKLNLNIDTQGQFAMLGNYELTQATYNFTFMNVIEKKFDIRPNSRITWTGSPYDALLDIKASYAQPTSLYPLLPREISAQPQSTDLRRRYPVSVLMLLTGELSHPQIDVGIEIKDYPRAYPFTTAVPSFEAFVQSNEQEMRRQVFNLLILRQFADLNTGTTVSDGLINGGITNLTEFLSNQLSAWASQIDQNFQIDFNVQGLTQENINNLQVRLSYSFLNGRLRVTRDGTFTNAQNAADARSVLGEWTLEYWIRADGKLRLKAYNRNNQNPFLAAGDANSALAVSTGFSLMHTQSFNDLSELVKPRKKPAPVITVPLDDEPPAPPADGQRSTVPPAQPAALPPRADTAKPRR